MAEGFAKELFGKKAEIYSAGVISSFVHPMAMKVMKEAGIDISNQNSKTLEEVKPKIGEKVDYVITLCSHAEQVCPSFPGEREHLHWPIEDPVQYFGSEGDRRFREVRDQIQKKIQNFYEELYGKTSE
jgi:arsenate reductase